MPDPNPASTTSVPNADLPELKYFPIRGKAEPIRLMLEDIGIKYVETRVGPEWTTTNKVEGIADGRYPFGQLPQYAQVSSGLNVTLVDPILKHLGRVKGYYGATENDRIRCDQAAVAMEEWRNEYTRLVYNPNFKELRADYLATHVSNWLQFFEAYLKRNTTGGSFLVGRGITYVDYTLLELLNIHLNLDPTCLQEYPGLVAYHERMLSRAGIRKYLQSGRRPERVNGRGAYWDNWSLSELMSMKQEELKQRKWF